MKRTMIVLAALALLASPKTVLALDSPVLTNEQIEHIRNNCGDTQTALGGIRANDKVAYVNIGQQAETLLNRLMAPMNSRIAINKLDGVALTKITVEFNAEIKKFQTRYREYEHSVDAATAMGCYNRPVEFFDNLTKLLEKRAQVRASYEKFRSLLVQYRDGVEVVQKQVLTEGQQ